jgi:hypothetical protein
MLSLMLSPMLSPCPPMHSSPSNILLLGLLGSSSAPRGMPPPSLAKRKFKSHASTNGGSEPTKEPLKPRHDPDAEGAVVVYRPKAPFDSRFHPFLSSFPAFHLYFTVESLRLLL